jgi:hypothetical protein
VGEGANTLIASLSLSYLSSRLLSHSRVSRRRSLVASTPTLSQPIASVRHPRHPDLTVDDSQSHGMQLSSYSSLILHYLSLITFTPALTSHLLLARDKEPNLQIKGEVAANTQQSVNEREAGGRAATLLPSLPSYPDTSLQPCQQQSLVHDSETPTGDAPQRHGSI